MAKKWTVEVDGSPHEVKFQLGMLKSKIIVDGAVTLVKSKNAFLRLIDEPITIGSKTLYLTVIGPKVDLAVDGVYLKSGKPYIPLSKVPSWATVILIVLLILGWLTGGLIGILIGVLGSLIVISNSLPLGKGNTLPRCLAITALVVCLQIAYAFFMFKLLYT